MAQLAEPKTTVDLSKRNLLLLIILIVLLITTTAGLTTVAVRYLTRAQTTDAPAPTTPFVGLPTIPSLPTTPPQPALNFDDCHAAAGTNNPDYDLNGDGIVNAADCLQLQ